MAARKKLTISISGPPGAGSSTVAHLLADKLGLVYFSPGKKYKNEAVKTTGAPGDSEAGAAMAGWKDEWLKSGKYHRGMDEFQKDIAREGGVVIDGKLSIRMLKGLADLRAWLTAPLGIRAARAAKRDNIPLEEAMELTKGRQAREVENWRKIYGFNYLDQEQEADLVIDTSDKSAAEVAELVIKHLKKL